MSTNDEQAVVLRSGVVIRSVRVVVGPPAETTRTSAPPESSERGPIGSLLARAGLRGGRT